MKKVYFVLTYTGTLLSSIIRGFTRDEYCHCSLSLDKELTKMYSFGRLNPYNPIIGGFTREGIDFGTFKRFKKTTTAIYELEISDKSYNKIVKIIEDFNKNKKKYGYNLLGLIAAIFGKRIKRRNHYYCSEFVKEVLNQADVENNLPKVPKPEDFSRIENVELIYQGVLRKYNRT